MERFNNLPHLLERRRELRKNMTYAEKVLWEHLRREGCGAKFRRQHSFKNFIIDFYCTELQIAIEVDGNTHNDEEVKRYDSWRQMKLEAYGIQFLRIPNTRFFMDGDQVADEIREAVKAQKATFAKPSYSKPLPPGPY